MLISTAIALLSFGNNQDTSLPIKLELSLQKEYTIRLHKDDYRIDVKRYGYEVSTDSVEQKHYDVQVTIQNTSTKPVYIWMMSCSWENNFWVNNEYIFMAGHDCYKNVPTLVEIIPGAKKAYTTTLIKSIKFDHPPKYTIYGQQVETTRMGLIIVNDVGNRKDMSMSDYLLAMEDKSKWKMVWSNALYLLDRQSQLTTIDVFKP